MMLKNALVELPKNKIIKHKTKKCVYIYHVLRAYRNDAGKPTCDKILIGKLDENSGKLQPNENYFDVFKIERTHNTAKQANSKNIEVASVKTSGVTDFFNKAYQNSSLDKIIQNVFPDKYKKIMILAMYMISEGNVMQHIENWCDKHTVCDNITIKSQEATRIFESITEKERMEFFKIMAKARVENEFVAYDVTSVSSYSKGIDSVEWGYNRDKEALPQINIGVYYGEESRLPLFYNAYSGSINDKSHLKFMLEKNKIIKMNKVKFVMDKGFYSKENIDILNKANARYIIAMPNSLKITQKLIKENRHLIVDKYETSLGAKMPYAKSFIVNDYGYRLKACVYYSGSKASDETDAFLSDLEEYAINIAKNAEKEVQIKYFSKYISIVEKGGRKIVEKNIEEINARIATHGFFVLLTTEHGLSELEILEKYRQKDVVEKNFDNLKNELDMKRLRCHSEESMQGKLFISFVALILKSYTYEKLRVYLKVNNKTYRGILNDLSKHQTITYTNSTKQQTPLTKTQREILALV